MPAKMLKGACLNWITISLERSRMRYWAWTADEVHLSLARLTHTRMLKKLVDDLTPEEQERMLAHTPVPEKRERWRILTDGGYTDNQLKAALDNVVFVFGRVDEELKTRGPWLARAVPAGGPSSPRGHARRCRPG